MFKGILYFPPESYSKPYPVILYFHGFPQLFALQEIVKKYQYLLDAGFAFLAINFRGYRHSEGKVSLSSQVSDGLTLVQFAKKMAKKTYFNLEHINILAHDIGAYIALLVCAKTSVVNKLLLLTPILDLERHVNDNSFVKTLKYINRFLPGNVQGVERIDEFIAMTKSELTREEFRLEMALNHLKVNRLKIILGEEDKITPLSELDVFNKIESSNIKIKRCIIETMDHEPYEEEHIQQINEQIQDFF